MGGGLGGPRFGGYLSEKKKEVIIGRRFSSEVIGCILEMCSETKTQRKANVF